MTSRFILNKFDLDLSPSRLLVGFGLLLILLVLCSTVHGILVIDKRVVCDGVWRGLCGGGVWVGRRGRRRVHIVGAGTLAHNGGRWGGRILRLVVLDGVGGERLRLGVGGVGGGRSGGHAAKRHAQRRRTESELRTLAGKGIEWEGEKGRLISLKPRCHLSPQTSAHRKLPLTPSARPAVPDPNLYTCYLPAPALPPPAQVHVCAPCVPAPPAPRDLPPAYPRRCINLPSAPCVPHQWRLVSCVSRVTYLSRPTLSLLFRH